MLVPSGQAPVEATFRTTRPYLDQLKSPFPRPRMFLIEKRAGHSWVVTILDLEHLRNGGAGGDISVHVSEKQEKQGKLAADEITLGGY